MDRKKTKNNYYKFNSEIFNFIPITTKRSSSLFQIVVLYFCINSFSAITAQCPSGSVDLGDNKYAKINAGLTNGIYSGVISNVLGAPDNANVQLWTNSNGFDIGFSQILAGGTTLTIRGYGYAGYDNNTTVSFSLNDTTYTGAITVNMNSGGTWQNYNVTIPSGGARFVRIVNNTGSTWVAIESFTAGCQPKAVYSLNCGTVTNASGSFAYNNVSGQFGTLNMPITVTTSGFNTFYVPLQMGVKTVSNVTTYLAAGMTNVSIPIVYDGTLPSGNHNFQVFSKDTSLTCNGRVVASSVCSGTNIPFITKLSTTGNNGTVYANLEYSEGLPDGVHAELYGASNFLRMYPTNSLDSGTVINIRCFAVSGYANNSTVQYSTNLGTTYYGTTYNLNPVANSTYQIISLTIPTNGVNEIRINSTNGSTWIGIDGLYVDKVECNPKPISCSSGQVICKSSIASTNITGSGTNGVYAGGFPDTDYGYLTGTQNFVSTLSTTLPAGTKMFISGYADNTNSGNLKIEFSSNGSTYTATKHILLPVYQTSVEVVSPIAIKSVRITGEHGSVAYARIDAITFEDNYCGTDANNNYICDNLEDADGDGVPFSSDPNDFNECIPNSLGLEAKYSPYYFSPLSAIAWGQNIAASGGNKEKIKLPTYDVILDTANGFTFFGGYDPYLNGASRGVNDWFDWNSNQWGRFHINRPYSGGLVFVSNDMSGGKYVLRLLDSNNNLVNSSSVRLQPTEPGLENTRYTKYYDENAKAWIVNTIASLEDDKGWLFVIPKGIDFKYLEYYRNSPQNAYGLGHFFGELMEIDFSDGKAVYGGTSGAGHMVSIDEVCKVLPTPMIGNTVNQDMLKVNITGAQWPYANNNLNSNTAAGDTLDDGVTLPPIANNTTSYTSTIYLTVGNKRAYLFGWADWNKNGIFETSERSTASAITSGNINLTWSGISGLSIGNDINFRFRVSTDTSVARVPNGYAFDGEVSDFQKIVTSPEICNNGIDDNGDGQIDEGCCSLSLTPAPTVTRANPTCLNNDGSIKAKTTGMVNATSYQVRYVKDGGNPTAFTAQTSAADSSISLSSLSAGSYTNITIRLASDTTCSVTIPGPYVLTKPLNCILPDLNATHVGVAVSGNLNTNDTVPAGTTYGSPTALAGNPSASTPTINANGTYSFTPSAPGTYQFNVPVCASGQTPPACPLNLLTITVETPNALNNPPVANNDVAITASNTPVTLNTLANDGKGSTGINPTTVAIVSNPTNGTVSVNPTTGATTYTPNAGFVGTDTIRYRVCDSNAKCDTAYQFITVQPTGSPNSTMAADDYMKAKPGANNGDVSLNDTDPQTGQTMTYTKLTDPPAAQGTVTFNANGTYTFTPAAAYTGPVQFTYRKCDNGSPQACQDATVYILVECPKPAGIPVINCQ